MKRELPVFNIEGTDFLVDVDKRWLIQAGNPGNFFEFIDMEDKGTHYEMFYDKRYKCEVVGVGPRDDQMIDIKIPPMVVLDPVGVAEKYGLTVEGLKGKTDMDIMGAEIQSTIRWPIQKEEQKDDKSLLLKLHEGRSKGIKF